MINLSQGPVGQWADPWTLRILHRVRTLYAVTILVHSAATFITPRKANLRIPMFKSPHIAHQVAQIVLASVAAQRGGSRRYSRPSPSMSPSRQRRSSALRHAR